jgi:uncharacterized protein
MMNFYKEYYRIFTTAPILRLSFAIFLVLFVAPGIALGDQMLDGKAALFHDEYETAIKLLQPLADQGSAEAAYSLGMAYSATRNQAQNSVEAARWYRKAAEQGNVSAQVILGHRYLQGDGVKQDKAEAAVWLRKAAEQGSSSAQSTVADMYDRGLGVAKDLAEAVKWHRKAAEQGNVHSQLRLGQMYQTGQGVPQDYPEAYFWYQTAAAQHASMHGDDTAAHLTPEQKVAAKKRLKAWKPNFVPPPPTVSLCKELKNESQNWRSLEAAAEEGDKTCLEMLLKAAQKGDAKAQTQMGFYSLSQRAGNISDKEVVEYSKKAEKWWRQASGQGDARAAAALGELAPMHIRIAQIKRNMPTPRNGIGLRRNEGINMPSTDLDISTSWKALIPRWGIKKIRIPFLEQKLSNGFGQRQNKAIRNPSTG